MIEQLADLRACAERCVDLARRAGASSAEAEIVARRELAVKVRRGRADLVHQGTDYALRLRVIKDHCGAVTFSNALAADELARAVRDALELAVLGAPDPLLAPPPKIELARPPIPELNLWDDDTSLLDVGEAVRRAAVGEQAARARDPRVTQVEGSCGHTLEATVLSTTAGFSGGYATSYQALMLEAVCDGDAPERKSAGRQFTASRFVAELAEPELVGGEAAQRAVAQLGVRPLPSCDVPVVFHPDAGRVLLELMPRVLNATAIARRASYLADREGQRVASPLVTLIDDPVVPRAIGSRPFDAEGLRARAVTLIDRGVLRAVLCDVYGARRLRRPPTGSAVRSGSGTIGGTSNLIMLPGAIRAPELIAKLSAGLYVTQLMGASFEPRTGRVARAASGFWVERGELAFPVARVNLDAPLDAILGNIDGVGDDLDFRTAFACPTFRVGSLRIAGR